MLHIQRVGDPTNGVGLANAVGLDRDRTIMRVDNTDRTCTAGHGVGHIETAIATRRISDLA